MMFMTIRVALDVRSGTREALDAETKSSYGVPDDSISPSCHQSGSLCLARRAGCQAIRGRVSDWSEVQRTESAKVWFNRHDLHDVNRDDFNVNQHDLNDHRYYVNGSRDDINLDWYHVNVNRHDDDGGGYDFNRYRHDYNVEQCLNIRQHNDYCGRDAGDQQRFGNYLSRSEHYNCRKLFWRQEPRRPDAVG
jgi:hypothetical protein